MRPRARLGAGLAVLLGCGARSVLDDPSPQSSSLVCGLSTVQARAGRAQPLFAAPPAGYSGRLLWTVLGDLRARVEPVGAARASFFTEVEGDYRVLVHGAAGVDEIGACIQTVRVRGTAPGAHCGTDLRGDASVPLRLAAEVRSVAPVLRTGWTLTAAPASSARPAPQGDAFTPDVVGEYTLRFEAVDAQGERDTCEVALRADPGAGLRVELSWDPPGRRCVLADGAECDRADLDLHLLRVGGRGWGSDDDCHYANCNASAGGELPWGGAGTDDNPRLLRDDTSGHGPEVVAVPSPAAGRYRIGVRYFRARGAGAQSATITVFCRGLTQVVGPVTLPADLPGDGAFWSAAELMVGDVTCAVRPLRADVQGWTALRGGDGP